MLTRCFQPPIARRRMALFASALVVLAALVGFTYAVPSVVQPQAASAQTVCNGTYDPFNMGCSSSNANFCNGNFNAFGTGCNSTSSFNCNGFNSSFNTGCSSAFGSSCNGSVSGFTSNCSTAYGSYCNGSYNNYGTNCSTAASYNCNGSYATYGANCSMASSFNCNGVGYSYSVSCPTTAGSYSCNGIGYSSPMSCLTASSTTCANGTVAYAGQACSPTYTSCANGGQVLVGQQCSPTIVVTASNPALTINTTPSYALPQGFSVTYAAGWNIVAGPTGSTLTGTIGPLYTFRPGDTAYETSASGSALTAGAGAWAYFSAGTTTTIAIANPGSMTVQLPASQFVMIGNSGDSMATVSGADAVLVYNPGTGSYNQTTQLAAGQGAWAISMNGGQATVSN